MCLKAFPDVTIAQSGLRVCVIMLCNTPLMRRVAQQRLFDQRDVVVNDGFKPQRRPSGDDRERPHIFQMLRGIKEICERRPIRIEQVAIG
jgi:hypothetical protein